MDILMPQLGETVAEGKITVWFKSVGDSVKPGDNLFEIETDKVSMEVPATSAGVLSEIRVPAGDVAPVGAIVAVIGDKVGAITSVAVSPPSPRRGEGGGEGGPAATGQLVTPSPQPSPPMGRGSAPSAPPAANIQATSARTQPKPPLDPFMEVRTPERNYGPARIGGATVTPLARRLAVESGIDLSRIAGSGPHGRIIAKDIAAARAAMGLAAGAARAPGLGADDVKAIYAGAPFEEMPLEGMRRTIARRLTEAKQAVPHFYLTTDITLDALLPLREQANAAAAKGEDGEPAFKLSINDFIIKALALALQRVPDANAVWAEDRILRFRHCDIGVAVAIEGGLLTPVVRQAEAKSLSAISTEMRDFAARARARRLKPDEIAGGVSAISNLGMHGVREFSAIINPPQSTILAVGASGRRPYEKSDGSVGFATQMTVTLSCDHRVIDGALGAELLAAVKDLLEHPVRMLV